MKKLSYQDILFRIGYFRNKNNLSARETSLQLGMGSAFLSRIERNMVELKVSTLLEFLDIVNITPMEFFYERPENYKVDKEVIDTILALSNENKQSILDIAKKIK